MIIRNSPNHWVVFDSLHAVLVELNVFRRRKGPTVFSKEHRVVSTICLSEHVAMYVIALTPFTGSRPFVVSIRATGIEGK